MKYTLKHRLIGAGFLVAIAVIFLPSFFKEKQAYTVSTKPQIPLAPKIVAVDISEPQPVLGVEPAPSPETMFISELEHINNPTGSSETLERQTALANKNTKGLAAIPQSAVPAMPLNSQGLPDAWVVQVGSFTTKEAAQKIRDDLQDDGIKAFVRSVPSGSSVISRVYIGPKLSRAQAQEIKAKIDKRLKVNSLVMHYHP